MPHLAHHLPIRHQPNAGSMVDLHPTASVGWLKRWLTDQLMGALHVTEMPTTKMTKDQFTALSCRQCSAKRPKVAQQASKTRGVPHRTFSLQLALTREQKLYLQWVFSIVCLAKRLACKHLGDQSVPMTTKRMQELCTRICTKHLTTCVYAKPMPKGEKPPKKDFKNVTRPNKFLPHKFHERLFKTQLDQQNKKARAFFKSNHKKGNQRRLKTKWLVLLHHQTIPSNVRNNTVLQFCQAVHATQGQTAERQHAWDAKMAAHQHWLRQQQALTDEEALIELMGARITKKWAWKPALNAIAKREKKQLTSKHPPHGERPAMGTQQVKPTDRQPVHTICIDARSNTKECNVVSWLNGDDAVDIRSVGSIQLWGSPSCHHRELQRLSARMHEGERGTRHQITIKYDHLLPDLKLRPLSATQPVRAVALDPGVHTMFGTYDSSGRFGDIGDGQIERVIRVAKKADRIRSHIDADLQGLKNKAKRCKARRRLRQWNAKCRDLKNDAHWKAARALCKTYDHVVIPKFHCAAMKRFLAKSSTRQLVHWSHFQFRQRLKHKAEELGVRVSECMEQLTSMMCAQCLWVEESFAKNASKVFECKKCGFETDWDHNASRNISLMNGERFIGRMEPLPAPALVPVKPAVEVVSLLAAADEDMADEDNDDGCTGWMWNRWRRRRRSMNTTTIG